MSLFIGLPLKVSTADGHHCVLLEPFYFVTNAGETIMIPAGAKSDGASTPKTIWNLIPPFGSYWPAAFMHDFLYRETQRPRAECDALFLEGMTFLGTPEVERETIYNAVRLGGESAFDGDRKAAADQSTPHADVSLQPNNPNDP